MRRPDLLMVLFLDPERFDAKDDIDFEIGIRHSEASPVLAANVLAAVVFPDTVDLGATITVHCNTDMSDSVSGSTLEIDFLNPLFVYGLNRSVEWFNCSFSTRVAQSVHPNESVFVNATAKYRSAPAGRLYSTSTDASGMAYDLNVTSWMEGHSHSHIRDCDHSVSATPVSNGEVAFLYLNVTLPESTTNLNYKINFFLNGNDTDTGNNRSCLYESIDNNGDLVTDFTVSADLGMDINGDRGRSLFSNTSSVQLGEIVNIGTGNIDNGDIVAITVSVKITGGQAGEVVTLQSVLSYESGPSIQTIYRCQEVIVLSSVLEVSLSLDGNTIEAGQVTVVNATIEDQSLVYSALRNVSFGLYSNVSMRAVGPLRLYYPDSSMTDASTSTNYSIGSQQPMSMYCSHFVTVSVPVSVTTDVRYGTLVGVTAVIQYSDYGQLLCSDSLNIRITEIAVQVPENSTLPL